MFFEWEKNCLESCCQILRQERPGRSVGSQGDSDLRGGVLGLRDLPDGVRGQDPAGVIHQCHRALSRFHVCGRRASSLHCGEEFHHSVLSAYLAGSGQKKVLCMSNTESHPTTSQALWKVHLLLFLIWSDNLGVLWRRELQKLQCSK